MLSGIVIVDSYHENPDRAASQHGRVLDSTGWILSGCILASAQKAASERSVACAVTRLAMLVAGIVGSFHLNQGTGDCSIPTEGLGQYKFGGSSG
jgi:hypothetical protein